MNIDLRRDEGKRMSIDNIAGTRDEGERSSAEVVYNMYCEMHGINSTDEQFEEGFIDAILFADELFKDHDRACLLAALAGDALP